MKQFMKLAWELFVLFCSFLFSGYDLKSTGNKHIQMRWSKMKNLSSQQRKQSAEWKGRWYSRKIHKPHTWQRFSKHTRSPNTPRAGQEPSFKNGESTLLNIPQNKSCKQQPDDWRIHNVANHQGNTDWNQSELLLHTCKNDCYINWGQNGKHWQLCGESHHSPHGKLFVCSSTTYNKNYYEIRSYSSPRRHIQSISQWLL